MPESHTHPLSQPSDRLRPSQTDHNFVVLWLTIQAAAAVTPTAGGLDHHHHFVAVVVPASDQQLQPATHSDPLCLHSLLLLLLRLLLPLLPLLPLLLLLLLLYVCCTCLYGASLIGHTGESRRLLCSVCCSHSLSCVLCCFSSLNLFLSLCTTLTLLQLQLLGAASYLASLLSSCACVVHFHSFLTHTDCPLSQVDSLTGCLSQSLTHSPAVLYLLLDTAVIVGALMCLQVQGWIHNKEADCNCSTHFNQCLSTRNSLIELYISPVICLQSWSA